MPVTYRLRRVMFGVVLAQVAVDAWCPCGVPCGVPARFALVLSSCWALLLVVFTATDHLCFIMPLRFIRAGSAIVGPLSGSQRALTLAVCGQEPWHSGMES